MREIDICSVGRQLALTGSCTAMPCLAVEWQWIYTMSSVLSCALLCSVALRSPSSQHQILLVQTLLLHFPCRAHELEEKLAASEASRAELEQQLALSRSQLADARALMDSAQVSEAGITAWHYFWDVRSRYARGLTLANWEDTTGG